MAPIPTGLHAPITNIVLAEAAPTPQITSPGNTGKGDLQVIVEESGIENIPRIMTESAMVGALDFAVPDMSKLSDIGVASAGPGLVLETVFGPDERVNIVDTTKYPWRATASLLITAADNSQWIGTAWFISPRTLATAGHCVYINNSDVPERNGFVKKIQVMPGRNGQKLPFGGMTATEFSTVKGWGERGLENFDYGVIQLPAAFPDNLGYLGYRTSEDEDLLKAVANIKGYPGDKSAGTLWYDNRKIGSISAEKVFYEADTYSGQSGACVYLIEKGERWAIAIHAYGGVTANSGTRISYPVASNLENWKRT